MPVRSASLAILLGGLAWFQIGQDNSAAMISQRLADLLDDRPIKSVLIVGNSRTFLNDMPSMVRQLAELDESPFILEVEAATAPGATFENHWSSDRTRRLLDAGWDEIILQGESGAQASLEQNESFQAFGVKLAGIARVHEGRPALLVNWPYDRSLFKDYGPYNRDEHLAFLKNIHARLAERAHIERLNLAGLWESVRLANPSIKLTTDGNHPTVAGSYLYALAVYAHATGAPVGPLSYVPKGLDPMDAQKLRLAVDAFPLSIR